MASYKDIITGTLGNLVSKAKEVAESGTVRGIYEQGASRAKSYGQIAKLTLELNGDHEELKRVYTEIGKLYYEQAKAAPEGFFAPLFSQAELIMQRITDKEELIQQMKDSVSSGNAEDDIDVDIEDLGEDDFEDVVDKTEEGGVSIDITVEKEKE